MLPCQSWEQLFLRIVTGEFSIMGSAGTLSALREAHIRSTGSASTPIQPLAAEVAAGDQPPAIHSQEAPH
jgi:hypothetical protein